MDLLVNNLSATVAATVAVCASLTAAVRWGLLRHREFIAFSKHMDREEREIWPSLQAQVVLQAQVASSNHAELLQHLSAHGERLARLEAKMPNGQLDEIRRMVETLLNRAR